MNKQSLYKLTERLGDVIRSHYTTFENNSTDINNHVNKWIDSHIYTDSGNRRYPKYYSTSLHAAAYAIRGLYVQQVIIHCYFYKGIAYTTHKGTTAHKTTRDLEQLLPMQQFSTKCTHGMYYNTSLKPYFVS